MKKILSLIVSLNILFSASLSAASQACDYDASIIGAKYQVSVKTIEGKQSHYLLNLWRNGQTIVYEYPQKKKAEYWYRSAKGKNKSTSIQLTRYYDGFERGIEYQINHKSVESTDKKWQKLSSIIAVDKQQFTVPIEQQVSCDQVTKLESQVAGITGDWLSYYQLPKQFSMTSSVATKTWKMTALITDAESVKLKINARTQFHVTDYADIGDNENDEFLSKMIVMGF